MVGWMKLDLIEAKSLRIERVQLRWVFVGLSAEVEQVAGGPAPAEGGQGGGILKSAIGRNGSLQRQIAGIEIDVNVRRRLVCFFVAVECSGHDACSRYRSPEETAPSGICPQPIAYAHAGYGLPVEQEVPGLVPGRN